MFSAGPGQVAKDGQVVFDNAGRAVPGNSPFSRAFAVEIAATQTDVFDAMRRVAIAVQREVPTQEPWLETDGSVVALSKVSFLPAGMKPKAATMVDPRQPGQTEDPGATAFTNSLGMKFVPVPGTEVLFCIHETRSRDFAAFMADRNRGYTMSGDDAEDWRTYEYKKVPVGRGAGEQAEQSNHPVANVSWLDAMAFCDWLSKKEGKIYRLPTDREWSVAVGIPQEGNGTPQALDSKIADVYPWGGSFVAASIQGNYADAAAEAKGTGVLGYINGYRDGFATTAPVMSFAANEFGLYDMGGNLWEWCTGCYDGTDPAGKDRTLTDNRVVRGGSWFINDSAILLSSFRFFDPPSDRLDDSGFRVVVVGRSGG